MEHALLIRHGRQHPCRRDSPCPTRAKDRKYPRLTRLRLHEAAFHSAPVGAALLPLLAPPRRIAMEERTPYAFAHISPPIRVILGKLYDRASEKERVLLMTPFSYKERLHFAPLKQPRSKT